MAKFRKRPVEIEAIQLSSTNLSDVCVFIGKDVEFEKKRLPNSTYDSWGITIETLEGDMFATMGDYIIKGVSGEFYPCKPDIFGLTYDYIEE